MKQETAKKRIKNAVEKELKNETQAVKDRFCAYIYNQFLLYENDRYDEHTSTENLNYSIAIFLHDTDTEYMLEEARKELNRG